MQYRTNNELSSLEETRRQFNGGTGVIKLGIDVHQDFYVVVEQVGGSNPKPPQRFQKDAFLHWAAKLQEKSGAEMHAVYEACGFGFGLQRKVKARKRLEAQGRSLMVNHGMEPVKNWWKPRTFLGLRVPEWMRELLSNSQPILVALQQRIGALTLQLQSAATPNQPRGLGALSSVLIDREIGDWRRFNNRRQVASYTGLCPGEYSSGNTRVQS